MLDVEVAGSALDAGRVRRLAELAATAGGVGDGHLTVEFVGSERIAELNARHRARSGPTDVLSFPIDEAGASYGPRELGDVIICPEHTTDLEEAVVHGVLHLVGMDHETDDGQMLELQADLLRRARDE